MPRTDPTSVSTGAVVKPLGNGVGHQLFQGAHLIDRLFFVQSQREHGDGTKAPLLGQHPDAVAEVCKEIVNEPDSTLVAYSLLDVSQAAEVAKSFGASGSSLHAGTHVLFGLHRYMELDLFVEFAVLVRPPQEGGEPLANSVDHTHGYDAVPSICSISAVARFQFPRSLSS